VEHGCRAGCDKDYTPRTRAIMVVHIYGLPVEMDPIMEVARKHHLRIIEDAAEALGQRTMDGHAEALAT